MNKIEAYGIEKQEERQYLESLAPKDRMLKLAETIIGQVSSYGLSQQRYWHMILWLHDFQELEREQ